MALKLFNFINRKFPELGSSLVRIWYWYINKIDGKGEYVFFNYGYAGKKIKLRENDERNRLQIQLYSHVASKIDLKNKELLEIGCGRGGGASYIAGYLQPKSVTGLDLCGKSIEFCGKRHSSDNLSFRRGSAVNLPFKKGCFDAVVNIESSHSYLEFNRFLREVYRVLRKNGFMLFADFRHKNDVASLEKAIKNSGFRIVSKEDITENVIEAMKKDNKKKLALIKKFIPSPFRNPARQFAGTEGSEVYDSFVSRRREYFCFVLKK
jgi:ubiquinone/menaquinone biosynthesis C-methylase UbiE